MSDKSNNINTTKQPRPLDMESETIFRGNIVIPSPYWNGKQWIEWIPWDEI
jgi:hypothetical protein